MEKYELTTFLSDAFKFNVYVIGIGFIGFMIYSLIVMDFMASIFCLFLILFWYFLFFKKIRKYANITFDSNNIYIEDQSFSFKEIEHIEQGKIILKKNGKAEYYFWDYFYGKNYDLLKLFYKNANEVGVNKITSS